MKAVWTVPFAVALWLGSGCGMPRERLWGPGTEGTLPEQRVRSADLPSPVPDHTVVVLAMDPAPSAPSIMTTERSPHDQDAIMEVGGDVERPPVAEPSHPPAPTPEEKWNWWATGILTATVITLAAGILLQSTPLIVIGGPLLLIAAVLSIALPRLRARRGKGLAVIAITLLLSLAVVVGGVLVKG